MKPISFLSTETSLAVSSGAVTSPAPRFSLSAADLHGAAVISYCIHNSSHRDRMPHVSPPVVEVRFLRSYLHFSERAEKEGCRAFQCFSGKVYVNNPSILA